VGDKPTPPFWRHQEGRPSSAKSSDCRLGVTLLGFVTMAMSSALSRSAFECALHAGASRPLVAAFPGHGQRCCPLKSTVKVGSENPCRATLSSTSSRAHRTRTLVAAAALKEGATTVDVDAPPSVLVATLLSLVCPSSSLSDPPSCPIL
jgi:hypothetical protein